jgi:hypothetical protein
VKPSKQEKSYDVICCNCQGKGHMSKQCRNPRRMAGNAEFDTELKQSGNEVRQAAAARRSDPFNRLLRKW